jgi:hypothetical protein
MYHFCTYFDSGYLVRGLALYRSLVRHARPFRLYVLCLDVPAAEKLARLKLPGVQIIPLAEFERGDAALLEAKRNRSRVEYYFTCTSSLPLYIFKHFDGVDAATYLDADLYFYGSPAPIYAELGRRSVGIVPHRFPEPLRKFNIYGIYNVGVLVFRNDDAGRACLHWWRARCLEWCYDRLEGAKFADQKYLDDWPSQFPGVAVLQHKGVNLAPWNAGAYTLRMRHGTVFVDGDPLIVYHFHSLKVIHAVLFDLWLPEYGLTPGGTLLQSIYVPYLKQLQQLMLLARSHGGMGLRYKLPTDMENLVQSLLGRHPLFLLGPLHREIPQSLLLRTLRWGPRLMKALRRAKHFL